MYGKECLSISGDQSVLANFLSDCIERICNDLVDLGKNEENTSYDGGQYTNQNDQQAAIIIIKADILELIEYARLLHTYSMDSMGLGVVYYWPNIAWSKE
jgi:hypothetical protein